MLLDALHCQNHTRPPVWLMRQAGRYMPEYRQIRSRYSFLTMCKTPELAAEITALPINAFGMDAAILFSDILVVAEGLGFKLEFIDAEGPVLSPPIREKKQITDIQIPAAEEAFGYVADAIRLIKQQLSVPLLGFAGAPFTVASYMIEGRTSRDLKRTKEWLYRDPAGFHVLLDKIAAATEAYLKMQVRAGVDAIQIFDSWANVLAYREFKEFSLKYLQRLSAALQAENVPVILFCKGSSCFAKDLAAITPNAISLDWNCHLPSMRAAIPPTIAIQGNLDPYMLLGPAETIVKQTQELLQGMRGDKGYIFNLGHGILPETPVDSVRTLINTIKNLS